MDLIDEVGHTGEFLTKEHTFHHCHTEPLTPTISVADPLHQIDRNIEKRCRQMLESYVQPEMDADTLEKVKGILVEHGVDQALLEKIERM